MRNQEEVDSKQEKLPAVNETNYKEMTETLLLDETEIQNLSYSYLSHLIDYLKAYQTTLIKKRQFQKAKQVSELRGKAISEYNFQTNQLNQYTQNESTTTKYKNKFEEETKNLEREILLKQNKESREFENKWEKDKIEKSVEYNEAKTELEEKFRQEIEDFQNSREQKKQEMMKMYKLSQNDNQRAKTSLSSRKSRNVTSRSKSRRPLTSLGNNQTKRSTNTAIHNKQRNTTIPDYSMYFPLYIWISKKKIMTQTTIIKMIIQIIKMIMTILTITT